MIIDIVIARVDERLIHGQIVNEWIQKLRPTHLLIVDYELLHDPFMSNIYKAMAPFWVEVHILSPKDAYQFFCKGGNLDAKVFLLARKPDMYEELIDHGADISEIVLAEKKYMPNKRKAAIESKIAINHLLDKGVRIVIQEFPNEESFVVKKYKIENTEERE